MASSIDDDRPAAALRLGRGVLSAFSANLVGIGLARFAYTPLLPAIVAAQWFSASAAAYLGAANLAGYLAGAWAGRPLAGRLGTSATLRATMLVAAASFAGCAVPLGFAWFFVWRALAGVAGGILMVLAAPSVLVHVSAARRGLAGGLILTGVGVGITASGTLVPFLLQQGLQAAWLGLALLALVLSAIAWSGWPADSAAPAPVAARPASGGLRALTAEYALNAAGWVPHMIFLVDFIARGRGEGLHVGALYWVLFGLAATVGPVLSGALGDTFGYRRTLRWAFALEAIAVAMPALGLGTPFLMVSTVVVGTAVTGTVALVLGRIHELLPQHPTQQKAAWSTATVAFALCQAGAAYALSFVFAQSGGQYRLLFAAGALAMLLALLIDLATPGRRPA